MRDGRRTEKVLREAAVAECLPSRIQNFVDLCVFSFKFCWCVQNSSTIFEFYSSIKQEVDCVSYLNSAVPYRILNLAGENSADPLEKMIIRSMNEIPDPTVESELLLI